MARPSGTKNPETKKIYATVNRELYEAMESLADRQGRTLAALASFALEYFMAECADRLYPLNKSVKKYPSETEDE